MNVLKHKQAQEPSPLTIDVFPQIVYTTSSSSRNTNHNMHLSSYSFYFQEVHRHYNLKERLNITPHKKSPLAKTFYLSKTSRSKAKTLPIQSLYSSTRYKEKGDIPDMSPDGKEHKHIINLVKRGSINLYLEEKKKKTMSLTTFLIETNKVKYVPNKSEESLKTRLMTMHKKLKMIKTINDYIYPQVLKVKEESMKNDLLRIQDQNQQNKIKKIKNSLDSNFVLIRDLYKQKEYHDKVYHHTMH